MNWKRAKCTEAVVCWGADWLGKSVGLSRIFPVCKVTCVGMWDQPLQTQSTKHSVIFWALKRQIANYDSQCLSEN